MWARSRAGAPTRGRRDDRRRTSRGTSRARPALAAKRALAEGPRLGSDTPFLNNLDTRPRPGGAAGRPRLGDDAGTHVLGRCRPVLPRVRRGRGHRYVLAGHAFRGARARPGVRRGPRRATHSAHSVGRRTPQAASSEAGAEPAAGRWCAPAGPTRVDAAELGRAETNARAALAPRRYAVVRRSPDRADCAESNAKPDEGVGPRGRAGAGGPLAHALTPAHRDGRRRAHNRRARCSRAGAHERARAIGRSPSRGSRGRGWAAAHTGGRRSRGNVTAPGRVARGRCRRRLGGGVRRARSGAARPAALSDPGWTIRAGGAALRAPARPGVPLPRDAAA